jgi:hypothetical protein
MRAYGCYFLDCRRSYSVIEQEDYDGLDYSHKHAVEIQRRVCEETIAPSGAGHTLHAARDDRHTHHSGGSCAGISWRKAEIISGRDYGSVTITIRFFAASDPRLTGVTFAPTRTEALMVMADLERRSYVIDLPTRNVLRTPRTEETVNQEVQGADELVLYKTRWPGLGVPRYRWLRGDSAWLPAIR